MLDYENKNPNRSSQATRTKTIFNLKAYGKIVHDFHKLSIEPQNIIDIFT